MSPFPSSKALCPPFHSESNASNGDQFKFAGMEYDAVTGQYYDRARYYDAAIGRPLTSLSQFSDDVIEPRVIDGAVTGLAVAVRRSAEGARKVQSGFVRHYALATVLGLAIIVVYLVARVG